MVKQTKGKESKESYVLKFISRNKKILGGTLIAFIVLSTAFSAPIIGGIGGVLLVLLNLAVVDIICDEIITSKSRKYLYSSAFDNRCDEEKKMQLLSKKKYIYRNIFYESDKDIVDQNMVNDLEKEGLSTITFEEPEGVQHSDVVKDDLEKEDLNTSKFEESENIHNDSVIENAEEEKDLNKVKFEELKNIQEDVKEEEVLNDEDLVTEKESINNQKGLNNNLQSERVSSHKNISFRELVSRKNTNNMMIRR